MKFRAWIPVLIVLLGIMAWLLWPTTLTQIAALERANQSVQPVNAPTDQTDAGKTTSGAGVQAKTNAAIADPNASQKSLDSYRQAFEDKNVPLDFYGRVIDQDSNSLSGVEINVRVRHWDINSFGSSIPLVKETDASGRFDVHGVTGDAFDIEAMGKESYELEPTKRGYGAVGGTATEPVIFKMWKTNLHEQLIAGQKSFHIVPDGRPYVISFAEGTISEAGQGDLKVWVKRPAEIAFGQRYGWSCEIDSINGGLLQETDGGSSMYVAPTLGYTQSFSFEQKIESGWGDSTGEKRFYLTLNLCILWVLSHCSRRRCPDYSVCAIRRGLA